MKTKIDPVELILRTGMEGWTKEKMWEAVVMLAKHSTSMASDNARVRAQNYESFKNMSMDELAQHLVITADDHIHYEDEAEDLSTSGSIVSEEA